MKTKFLKKAGFTLVEVNLAIFIMATGVLSMCALYTLGYRENSQSVEDVDATAYADVCLAPLIAALSSPTLKWSDWIQIGQKDVSAEARNSGIDGRWPRNGWRDYIETESVYNADTGRNENVYRVKRNCTNIAQNDAFGKVAGCVSSSGVSVGSLQIPTDYKAGLVITRRGAVIQLAFRLSRRAQSLLAQPIIVAEVHFQGGFGQQETTR